MKHKLFNNVYPYTYYIKHKLTGLQYYGVRTANVKEGRVPSEDFCKHYFTSGSLKEDLRSNPGNFIIKLQYTFDTDAEAIEYEQRFVSKIFKKETWANNAIIKSINYTPEIRAKMSVRNYEYREEFGMTLGEYRGQESKRTRIKNNSIKQASIKASETMRNTYLDTGETMHEYRIRKGLDTRSKPDENGSSINQRAGVKISDYLNKVESNGKTVSQNKFRSFIAKLKKYNEDELDKWLSSKNERYQKFIITSLNKY